MGGRNYKYWVAGGFLLLAALDLSIGGHTSRTFHTFIRVLPTWFLFAATFRPHRPECLWIPLAFLFSGVGDMMGVQRQFLWQIAFFAIAHIAFIAGFSRRIKFSYMSLGLTALLAAALAVFFARMFPHIGDPEEKIFVTTYAVIIFCMGAAAMFQTGRWHAGYAVAAIFFIFSDSVIAWRRFVGPVPHSALVVMTTYYAAQLAFAFTLLRRAEKA